MTMRVRREYLGQKPVFLHSLSLFEHIYLDFPKVSMSSESSSNQYFNCSFPGCDNNCGGDHCTYIIDTIGGIGTDGEVDIITTPDCCCGAWCDCCHGYSLLK